MVRSTIASGRLIEIDDADARAAAGVLTVITHQTAPKLTPAPFGLLGHAPPPPLQDDRIHHHGQYVAVVVAATPREAAAAARLVKVDYEPGDPLLMDFDDPRSELEPTPGTPTHSAETSTPASLRPTSCTRRRTPPPRTPTTRSGCSRPLPHGRATPSPCTTPPSGPRTRRRRSPECSGSSRPRSGSVRPTSAARSGPASSSGST